MKKISNLKNKLAFIELLDEMNHIERVITLKSWKKECDASHSYQLAMIASVLLPDFEELDELKCLKIALYHDLVEIFAWDTYFLDEKSIKTKKQREKESLAKIENVLWKENFKEFKKLINEYEEKSSKEALFIYQLDKLQPIIQIYLWWWADFHTYKALKKDVIENKYSKIDNSFWLREILDFYIEKMEKENMFYLW